MKDCLVTHWLVLGFTAVGLFGMAPLSAGSLRHAPLEKKLAAAAAGFDGRVGVCVQDSRGVSCVDRDGRYSLQSVMKLVVGLAVLDAVDHRGWRLHEPVVVRREDLSVYVQPIAKLVTGQGYRTTVGDLVRRAVVDSDSAAVDILLRKLGGAKAAQAYLDRMKVRDVRIDRDERHLQSDIVGLTWRPEFVDPKVFDAAIQAVPKGTRDERYRAYQKDVRDTATPRGMTAMLYRLAAGELLSSASTKFAMDVMEETVTFPDRLKAGARTGWTVGHKTGSSGSWEGVTAATNDAGIFRAPDGGVFAISVFIGDTRAAMKLRAALMAKLAAIAVQEYR